MELIQTISDLTNNIQTLDEYLNRKTEPSYSFALGLVKRGICFIAKASDHGYRFYPSRFIGYLNNTMTAHENNEWKDGKETNPAISKILGCKPAPDAELDQAYQQYCEQLGFTANLKGSRGIERKYWRI